MRVNSLSKTYKPKSGEVKALDSLSFDLPEKGIVFVLGKSGSGKSTLLNLLSGLDDADNGGVIEVGGKNIVKCSAKERDGYRNSCCGFVFQEYNLIPELNVKENIKLSCQLQGGKDNDEKVERALERVELSGYGARKVTELSGGQKQRVAIARAIVKEPKIVFADEPTGALDEATGESIFELLKEIAKDRLVIVVSHDREFATKYGDRIIELANGKIVSDSDAGYVCDEQVKVEFKKPKLPTKTAAKIGCANFKFHPIRLAATILLSVIAFAFLGVALSSAFNPYANIVYRAMVSDGVAYSAVNRIYDESVMTNTVSRSDKENIDKSVGISFGVVYSDGVELSESGDNIYDSMLPYGLTVITSELVDYFGFSVTGRLPQTRDEIALTVFSADIINRLEYKMSKISDIVGESLTVGDTDYCIVGIIDTHFASDKFAALKTLSDSPKLEEMYSITLATSVHNLMFVCDDNELFGDVYDTVIVKTSRKILPYISSDGAWQLNNYTAYSADSHKITIYRIKQAAGILAAVFGVFAAILMLNFLLQSFTDKMFTLGILKASGCDSNGLMKVFLCEAFVIAAIVFAIASLFTVVGGICLNAYFGVSFFGAFYAALPLIAVAVSIVAVLGCVLPIIKIARMTAVDVIGKTV